MPKLATLASLKLRTEQPTKYIATSSFERDSVSQPASIRKATSEQVQMVQIIKAILFLPAGTARIH
jgi:hypothetical protein